MKVITNFQKLSLLIALVFLLGCARNPVTGKREFMLMSEKREIALGASSDPQVVASFGLYNDKKLQNFINNKGQKMARVSHRPKLKYEFKIVDSPVVNAFALPGGYVYFTRGILAHFNNEAEFAGVLGHEIGHITARHGAKQFSKQTAAQVGLIVGLIVSPTFRQFAKEASQGMQLLFLKFSRNNESQADRLGVAYSTKIGYDSKEMAEFFKTLSRMRKESGSEIPTFMSTHPDPEDRYNKVLALSKETQAKYKGKKLQVNRNKYLRMIDGLVYGEDPMQGYVDDDHFYHPELKFDFPIPRGWRTANTPQQLQMGPENGKAMMVLHLSPSKDLNTAKAELLKSHQLNLVESRNIKVNGFSAMEVLSEQVNQQNGQHLEVFTYLIKYGKLIYEIDGMSLKADFQHYVDDFKVTMKNFKKLTDPKRINVKPERIKIVTASTNTTLKKLLVKNGIKSNRLSELSLINGMELNASIKKGTLIKIVTK